MGGGGGRNEGVIIMASSKQNPHHSALCYGVSLDLFRTGGRSIRR